MIKCVAQFLFSCSFGILIEESTTICKNHEACNIKQLLLNLSYIIVSKSSLCNVHILIFFLEKILKWTIDNQNSLQIVRFQMLIFAALILCAVFLFDFFF